MKKHDFDVFFETVISKCIEDLETYSKTQFPNKDVFSKKKNMRKSIFHNYQNKRDFIKHNYMSKEAPVALDRHKVAACMVYAILKSNPLKINMWILNLPEKIVLANEYLAFYVALNIIEMYKKDEFNDKGIFFDYQIIIPKTYHEDNNPQNTYESNLCKAWYYIKINSIKNFDVLAYANVFFLLQKYTDTYLEMEMIKEKMANKCSEP